MLIDLDRISFTDIHEFNFKEGIIEGIISDLQEELQYLLNQVRERETEQDIPVQRIISLGLLRQDVVLMLMRYIGENGRKEIIGMAQGSLIETLSERKVYVDNVVIDKDMRRHTLGTLLMQELHSACRVRFGKFDKFFMTDRQSRGTKEFCEGLGYCARVGEQETVLYEKVP